MERSRRKLFDRMRRSTEAANRLGVSVDTVRDTLTSSGVGREDAAAVLAGEYAPYTVSRQLYSRIKDRPDAASRMEAYWEAWSNAENIDEIVRRYEQAEAPDVKELLMGRISEFAHDVVMLPGKPVREDAYPPVVQREINKQRRRLADEARSTFSYRRKPGETLEQYEARKRRFFERKQRARELLTTAG